ncbi:type VI secretion system baseplate subunit TssF [Alteromonas sp. a30]|uniref:type VI secretion system baseplate subunit TssF n=1 Tax=Alteromonas sp. a30 TaxID=2730917 RepID=UPI002281CB74|nr:type VI secretion system baseplate subunit TssF [Alteromonas sp. a30]MCY7293840.1 type VI secretion system baseplate subunit TssF [Alteromonas sp. a30]
MTQAQERLTDYFKAELADLRSEAVEFAKKHNDIATELALSSDNGESRDPHVELLMQSFAWMTGRLRQNLEAESQQLPAMMLQQLYPQLVSPMPSMAVIECKIKMEDANFVDGYHFDGSRLFEPKRVSPDSDYTEQLSQCRFSSCYEQTLWPIEVKDVQRSPLYKNKRALDEFPTTQSILGVNISLFQEGKTFDQAVTQPLRFYINLAPTEKYRFYDFLAQHFLGVVAYDENQTLVAKLPKSALKFAGFDDHERALPATEQQDYALTLLLDFMNFPEKFMFFDIQGLENVRIGAGLNLRLLFSHPLPSDIEFSAQSLKLNCVPVVNLFPKTSEPVPLTLKDYRYKLYPSRKHYNTFEIYRINKIFSMNRRGESRELQPFFSLSNTSAKASDYRWKYQIEPTQRKTLAGTETWVSLFNKNFDRNVPKGETIYAQTLSCNRAMSELFQIGQNFNVVGSSPISDAYLVMRPTRYRGVKNNHQHMWKLLSHLSTYYVSLTDNSLAKTTLQSILDLYADQDNPRNQQYIESIESFTAEEDVFPVQKNGWRGYYHGVNFKLSLKPRDYDTTSSILFGNVLTQFLALFNHVNAFVRMELFISDQKVYEWKPISGHKKLA